VLSGQHTVSATEVRRQAIAKSGQEMPRWCTHFRATILGPSMPYRERRLLAGEANAVQQSGRPLTVGDLAQNFLEELRTAKRAMKGKDGRGKKFDIRDVFFDAYQMSGFSSKQTLLHEATKAGAKAELADVRVRGEDTVCALSPCSPNPSLTISIFCVRFFF